MGEEGREKTKGQVKRGADKETLGGSEVISVLRKERIENVSIYWVGQKVLSSFPIRCYRKIQTNIVYAVTLISPPPDPPKWEVLEESRDTQREVKRENNFPQ